MPDAAFVPFAELQSSLLWFGIIVGGGSCIPPSCHGPSLDDDKAPAMGHGSSLDNKALVVRPAAMPATTPAATSITKLPTVGIGKHDLSFESHSI